MAIVLKLENEDRLSLHAFVDHLDSTFDLDEADSLIGVAPHFRALANNPDLVARHFNAEIQRVLDKKSERISSPLVIAHGANYSLQAKIWMPDALGDPLRPLCTAPGDVAQAHNHNFNVMTIGYFGPGPAVDLYAFDGTRCRGEIGERVDLRFIEQVRLEKNRAVICRETADAHAHTVPETLSISLSLCIAGATSQSIDRFVFDTQTSSICGYVESADIYRRASVVRLAGEVGDGQTLDLFDELLRRAPCMRVREAALTAASRLKAVDVSERRRVIGRALKDSNAYLRQRAKTLIDQFIDSV